VQTAKNLTSRVRTINFAMPAVLITIILAIAFVTSQNIADDMAQQMSRQYSIEAAANFQAYLNPHMILMRQMAASRAISLWLNEEDSPLRKAQAFESMTTLAATWPEAYFMFTVYDSLRGYNLFADQALEDFLSWGEVEHNRDTSQWFFDTRDAYAPFIINIQRSRPDEYGNWEMYIWTNHRVYYQGRFVGVFTLGSPFTDVYYATFGGFGAANRRGYIVDRFGNVRLDSFGIVETEVDGLPVFHAVPESLENPVLAHGIQSHLARLDDGIFQLGTATYEAIPLAHGAFRYASITPIIGTDWSIVVLSAHNGGLDLRYVPLIVSTVILLILYAFFSNAVMSRILYVLREKEYAELIEVQEQSSHAMTQSLIDFAPYGINLWDDKMNLLFTNKCTVDLFGFKSKGSYISNFHKTSPKHQPCGNLSSEMIPALLKQAYDEGYAHFEWMHCATDGREIPTEITLVRIIRNDKPMIVAYTKDMSQAKAAMEKEREISEKLQQILYSAPIIINQWDENGKLVATSEQVLKWFGATEKEYIENFNDFAPEYQPCGMRSEEKSLGYIKEAFEKGTIGFEWMSKARSGELIPCYVTLVCLEFKGKTVQYAFTSDLRAVKDAENLLQVMQDNSPLFLETWDEDGNFISCNRRMRETFGIPDGISLDEYPYQFSSKIQPCGTPVEVKNTELMEIAKRDGIAHYEWEYLLPNGDPLPTSSTCVHVNHNGKSLFICYSHDIRQLKNAAERVHNLEKKLLEQSKEMAEESSRAKSRFLARMSHEIRTPLTAVIGIAEIQLRNPEIPFQMGEALGKIHDSAQLLLDIVNDILDFSKIESGKMSMKNREYDVARLVNDATQLHTVYVEHRNVAFKIDIDESLPTRLIGDVLRIRQIINNLLSNAFKYTDDGAVSLSLTCSEEVDGVVNFIIDISDTGLGLSEEQLQALEGSEYLRFHEKDYRSASGTGLGIPIVFSLVQMMDGHLAYTSEVGKGTKVRVRIPQKTCGAKAMGKEIAAGLQNHETYLRHGIGAKKFVPEPMPYGKVLVVDDVDANLFVAKGLLSFYDLEIETCKSGKDAIEKIKSGNVYDIVFLDYLMPDLNGDETMRAMRGMGYFNPIVALTANAIVGQAEEFIESGFDGFLSKPIQALPLNDVLTKFIRDKQLPGVVANRPAKPPAGINDFLNTGGVSEKLRVDFAISQRDSFENISRALEAGDIKSAHRLVHSLKSVAALISEHSLVKIAGEVETMLEHGKLPGDNKLLSIKNELANVLDKIDVPKPQTHGDMVEIKELLDKLEPLLNARSNKCKELLGELKAIPEAAVIAWQIEKFDFATAQKNLKVMREMLA